MNIAPKFCASLLAFVVPTITGYSGAGSSAVAQDVELQVTGPANQWVSVAVRYFTGTKQQTQWTSNQQRLKLEGGKGVLKLQQNAAGYAVDVYSPIAREIELQLKRGDKVLAGRKTSIIGHSNLRHGLMGSLQNLRASEIALKARQRDEVREVLAAFDRGDTEQFVSEAEFSNIDWPTLNAMAELTRVILGRRDDQLEGWVQWPGKKGSTVFSGVMAYQRGNADTVLVLLGGKVVDFVIKSDSLPKSWHTGEAAITEYSRRGEQLLRLIFDGDVEEAHKIFSYRVAKQITVEKLIPLSQQISARYGNSIKSVQLRDHRFEDVKQRGDKKLMLYFDVVTDRDVVCDARVEIYLDQVNGTVARGHFSAFNVKQKGPEVPPDARKRFGAVVTALLQGNSEPLVSQLPESLKPYVDDQQLVEELDRWQEHFGPLQQPIPWSRWTDTDGKKGAQGPAVLASGEATIRIDFGKNNLLGVTVIGDSYAGSTLGCVIENEAMSQHAVRFWRHMFSKQVDQAYDMLPDLFQKQLTREKFHKLSLGLKRINVDLADVEVRSIRINTKPKRVSPGMIEVICNLRFANNGYEAVKSEYHVGDGDKFSLYTFNTEFSQEFPVRFGDHTDFLHAIASGNSQRLIDLFHPSHNSEIDQQAVQALMQEIRRQWGGLDTSSIDGIAIRSFNHASDEITKVSAMLPFDNATVPAEWTYVYGHVKSFHFNSPDVAAFPKNITDTSEYRSRSQQMFQHWFGGDPREAIKLLMPDLHNQNSFSEMVQTRKKINKELGEIQSIAFQEESWLESTNSLKLSFLLTFSKGRAIGTTTISFDALHSLMVATKIDQINEPKDPDDGNKVPAEGSGE